MQPAGVQASVAIEHGPVEFLHDVAKQGPLGAARGQHLLRQLGLVVGGPLGPDDDHVDLVVVVEPGQHVVTPQHVLVDQVADGEMQGIVADGHHRHDLPAVQEQGERPLDDDAGFDRPAILVEPGQPSRQPRIGRVGDNQRLVAFFVHRRDHWCSVPVPRARPAAQPFFIVGKAGPPCNAADRVLGSGSAFGASVVARSIQNGTTH